MGCKADGYCLLHRDVTEEDRIWGGLRNAELF